MSQPSVALVNPLGQAPTTAAPVATPVTAKGRRLGFLSNRKPNASVVQHELGRLAEAANLCDSTQYFEKHSPGEGAPESLLDTIAASVDLAMVGSADCGSCTTWSVYDAVELEKRGVPAIVLTTEAFKALASVQRTAMGRPDLALFVVPHPLGGSPAEVAAAKANDAWPVMEAWLKESTDKAVRS